VVRGERRSDLNLFIAEENADVARDFVRTGVYVPDLSELFERLTKWPNGEGVILPARNAVNTHRHAFASWLTSRCQRLRSGPNRWQGYRVRKAMALLFWEQLDSAYHRQIRRAKCVLARNVSGNATYQELSRVSRLRSLAGCFTPHRMTSSESNRRRTPSGREGSREGDCLQ
jgi:hypothetical protein